jgi:hypothetical protein
VNLKDKANPGLRASVVDGTIAPERFAAMTSQVKSLLVLLHWLGLIIY